MKREDVKVSTGIGLPIVVFIVFLILKLVGVISWSWWWVTAPLWGSFVLTVVFAVLSVLIFAFKHRK